MKQLALIISFTAFFLTGCNEEKAPAETPTAETEQAATLNGTYQGVLPCASCLGIDTTLILKDGNRYELTTLFLEEQDAKPETVTGSYSRDGDLIRLDAAGYNNTYFIGDKLLEMRNQDGTTGQRSAEENAAYRLQKQ